MPARWRLAHGAHAAFSSRADGDQHTPHHRQRFLQHLGLASACWLRQVHGIDILDADDLHCPGRHGDGLVGTRSDYGLIAFGADCPAVALVTPAGIGIAHCGWRGTAAGIVRRLVERVAALPGSGPTDEWQALIGPGICGSCYEVDAPVLVHTWPSSALYPGRDAQHRQLDLPTALADALRREAVGHIVHSALCTACSQDHHSYRHDGAGLVQSLVVWRDEHSRQPSPQ